MSKETTAELVSLARRWHRWAAPEARKSEADGYPWWEAWAAKARALAWRARRDELLAQARRQRILDANITAYYTDRAQGAHAAKAP